MRWVLWIQGRLSYVGYGCGREGRYFALIMIILREKIKDLFGPQPPLALSECKYLLNTFFSFYCLVLYSTLRCRAQPCPVILCFVLLSILISSVSIYLPINSLSVEILGGDGMGWGGVEGWIWMILFVCFFLANFLSLCWGIG